MKKMTITKIQECENSRHPKNIETGYTNWFIYDDESKIPKPTIGQRFTLFNNLNHWFSTSMVDEIIDENTFKTLNSIYQIKIEDIND